MKKSSSPRFVSKALSFYYGNPAKDMKLIAVVSDDPAPLPTLIQNILSSSGKKSAVISAPSLSKLHRAISKAWKSEATYGIITAPISTLRDLPVTILVADRISSPTSFVEFAPKDADFLVLNHDDISYPALQIHPSKTTKSYGHHHEANTRIDSSKPYKTAIEARLTLDNRVIDVAAFLTGDTAPSLLAAATTVADLLGISKEDIVDGLASYEPSTQA